MVVRKYNSGSFVARMEREITKVSFGGQVSFSKGFTMKRTVDSFLREFLGTTVDCEQATNFLLICN